jgi:hypothetical protein
MQSDNSRIAHGGKGLYGSRVGILMLETRFPRIPGDMGNGNTWPFPVLYKVVPGATPDRVVRHKSAGLTNAFLDAAAELVQWAPTASPPLAGSCRSTSASWRRMSACRSPRRA